MDDLIAIIGMSLRVPGAADLDSFWRNLVGGKRSRTELPLTSDDPDFVPVGYLLDDVENFDAGLFGLTPAQAALTDPQHRLFLELCHAALENAGWDPARFDGDIGVYGGRGMETYRWRHIYQNRAVSAVSDHTTIGNGNHADALTTLASYQLNLRGPSVGVYTACSTSLVAVHMAAEALRAGECDMALAGGVNIELPGDQGYLHREGGMESADGNCHPFDASATGTVAGSGGGVVLLKRLSDAIADGDNVRAVVLGNAVNNDGASKVGFTAASVTGQAVVIANALANAGVDAPTISYVETSATGSPLGDSIEVEALSSVFGRAEPRDAQWCAIGSVKSNIGHLSQGAGVVGLIKTALSLEHGLIPPSLGFTEPNPAIDFDKSPFYVNATLSVWERGEVPRRAGVSSFGIGGTNAHVILEEAPPVSAQRDARPSHLITLSARSDAACQAAATRLADHLTAAQGLDLGDVAYTLRAGRVDHPHRTAVVATSLEDAAAALRDPKRRVSAIAAPTPPRVVFLFPGSADAATEPVVLDECGDEAPQWFSVGYANAKQWQSWGIEPATMIGHGPGELIAATLAGVFDLPQAVKLAALYEEARTTGAAGAMLAVSASESELQPFLNDGVSLVAVNGPKACVVAGPEEQIQALAERLPARKLRTTHPHQTLAAEVRPAAPRLPFLSGRTGRPITHEQATDPAYWTSLLTEPVRFGACVANAGEALLLECGPGKQLAGLAQMQASKYAPVASLGGDLLQAAGRLWAQGVPLDLGNTGRRVPLPGYPYERTRHWIEPDPPMAMAPLEPVAEPKSPTDELIGLWTALLGHAGINAQSDFFELGGSSLTAVQLIAQVRAVFGVRLPMRAIFDTPTLSEMAEAITRLRAQKQASQAK